jgi:hypothetical protein
MKERRISGAEQAQGGNKNGGGGREMEEADQGREGGNTKLEENNECTWGGARALPALSEIASGTNGHGACSRIGRLRMEDQIPNASGPQCYRG